MSDVIAERKKQEEELAVLLCDILQDRYPDVSIARFKRAFEMAEVILYERATLHCPESAQGSSQ